MNKRTVETKRRIENAIMDEVIMGNIPMIKSITKSLGLNRNTFYLHYANIDEAIKVTLDKYTNEMIARIDRISIKDLFDHPDQLTQIFIDVLCTEDKVRKFTLESMVSYGYVHDVTNRLVDYVYDRYQKELNDRGNCFNSVNFLIAGFVHSIYKSINQQGYNREKINDLQNELASLVQTGVAKKLKG